MTQVLVVAPPLIGGRAVGAGLAEAFGSAADVTVVETTDENPAALGRAQAIFTGLGPVTAEHSPRPATWNTSSAPVTVSTTSTLPPPAVAGSRWPTSAPAPQSAKTSPNTPLR